MFACEFYRWVEAIRGEQLLLIECLCFRSEQHLPKWGCSLGDQGCWGTSYSWGYWGGAGCPHTPHRLWLQHHPCPPALAATTDTHPSAFSLFLLFYFLFSFIFFFIFFFCIPPISYSSSLTPRQPHAVHTHTYARSVLTCICHSLYTHTFGHVMSISQFASLLSFILPLVSLCQKKAEGGAVRKAFFALRFESTFLALTF